MFKIYGGKTEFTQWGMDQRVTNPNMKDGDEVAFQARGKTYLRRAYARSGEIVADVPNFILQEAGEITVKLGLGLEEHLASRTTFNVAKQDKPEGYDCKYNINNREPNRQLVTDAYGKEVWEERLAWSDGKREVEIFPETTLPYSETHEGFVNIGMGIGLVEGISVGDVAVVSYNGVEYTCVAEAFAAGGVSVGVLLGETAPMTGAAPTGKYPFVVAIPNLEGVQMLGANLLVMDFTERTDPVTVSVKVTAESVHKLDNKYLDLDWVPATKSSYVDVFSTTISVPGAGMVTLSDVNTTEMLKGSEAIVTFDGVEYRCGVEQYQDSGIFGVYIGNRAQIDQGKADTGEPFLIFASGETCAVCADKGEHEIGLVMYTEDYAKMPAKFFPAQLTSFTMVSEGGAVYKFTVSEEGNLTATYLG